MIYYYFGSKEKLYGEVLKQAYTTIRAAEQTIDVDHSDPALRSAGWPSSRSTITSRIRISFAS